MTWFRCMGGNGGPGPSGFEKILFGELVPNVYIKDNDGTEAPYNSWSATDYIEISGDELTVVGTRGERYNAFYTSNKTFISSFYSNGKPITIPQNAKYIRLSDQTNSMSSSYYIFCGTSS